MRAAENREGGWRLAASCGVLLTLGGCVPAPPAAQLPEPAPVPDMPAVSSPPPVASPPVQEAPRRVPAFDLGEAAWGGAGTAPESVCAPAWPGQACSADCFCVETPGALWQPATDVWVGDAETWVIAGGYLFRWDGQGFRRVPGGRNVYRSVWGSGPRDVWAVGQGGEVSHWDGERLTSVDVGTAKTLLSVWGSSAQDVWAVGQGGEDAVVLLHWDGVRWSDAPRPTFRQRDLGYLTQVTGGGPTSVWVVAQDGLLAQWDGVQWNDRSIPGVSDGDAPYDKIRSLFVRGNGTALASGYGETWQWDGAAWSALEGPWGRGVPVLFGGDAVAPWAFWRGGAAYWNTTWSAFIATSMPEQHALLGVGARGAKDVWAVGERGLVQRWNGHAWQVLAVPLPAPRQVLDLWFHSASEGWAVDGSGSALRWDGARWLPVAVGDSRDVFTRVWGSSPTDLWFTGRTVGDWGSEAPLVVRWDGERAHRLALPAERGFGPPSQVWGTGPEDVWLVVNDYNGVWHWDGHALSRRSLPRGWDQDAHPLTVWGSGPDDVWLGAQRAYESKTLFHWDGHQWTPAVLPFTPARFVHSVFSLWGSSARDVWALGDSGLMHFDGEAWKLVLDTQLSSYALQGGRVVGSGPDDVWVSGLPAQVPGGPRVAHFDGRSWRPVSTGESWAETMGGAPGAFWAAGAGGLLRYRPAPSAR